MRSFRIMQVYSFEELVIWQEARVIVDRVYLLLKNNRDYDFKSQISRAAISIMNNIAEGFERNKNSADNKQFKNFLNISYGSCGEVRSMIYLAQDLKYMNDCDAEALRADCYSLSCKITAFMQTLR